jgi:hypothetical protein
LSSFTLYKQLVEEISSHEAPPSPRLWERLRLCARVKNPLAVGDMVSTADVPEFR